MMVRVSGSSSSRFPTLEIVFFNFYHHSLLFVYSTFLFPVSSIDLLKRFIHCSFPIVFEKPKISFLKPLDFSYFRGEMSHQFFSFSPHWYQRCWTQGLWRDSQKD